MNSEATREASASAGNPPGKAERVVRFANFELNLNSGELRKSGIRIKLQEQPLKVLTALLERPGQVVTREELRERIWPGNGFGDFDHAINLAVGKLRGALGDAANVPRLIETLPRRGYRLIAPVTAAIDSTTLPKAFDSLAVLPLVNATGDSETDYLSDGISESLINLLSQLPNLRVVPRTSAFRYKSREADLKAIARDLKVRTVLTGKMTKHGDRVVVQTELVDVANDAQLWGGQF